MQRGLVRVFLEGKRMIRIDYIQEFVTLASCLSFSRASEDLFITQPSLSRHVSLLEAELGLKLVERNTRNDCLTQAGMELYTDFNALLNAYQTLQDHAAALSSGYCGQFRLSVPYYWLSRHLESAVLGFNQSCPDIRVDINVCSPLKGIELLQKNKTDIVMSFETYSEKTGVIRKRVAREQLGIVMSSDHPNAGRKNVAIRDFPDDKFIILELDNSQDSLRGVVQYLISECGIAPAQFLFTQNLSTVGITIRKTGGVSILMECFGNLDRDYLVFVPLSEPGSLLPIYLYMREDNNNKAARAFFDEMQEVE